MRLQLNDCIMQKITCSICILALAPAFLFSDSIAKIVDPEEDDWARSLHVIVLESNNVKNILPENRADVVALKSADLPLKISQVFFPLSTSSKFDGSELDMPGDMTLWDIYTFNLLEREIKKDKPFKRTNDSANLSYALTVRNLTDDFCEVDFTGKRLTSYASTTARLSRKTTTLIRIRGLCFVFTFVSAAMNSSVMLHSANKPDPNSDIYVYKPRLKKGPLPQYPETLSHALIEGRFRFLGIVTSQGAVVPSSGIVLECFHWLFARNALDAIFNHWEFTPGELDNEPASMLSKIEITYQLTK
jgi:hypothetical protein